MPCAMRRPASTQPIHSHEPPASSGYDPAAEKKLAEGKAIVFTGPIVDQSGKEVVAAGKEAEIGMLKGMNFYVKGVEGSIPK